MFDPTFTAKQKICLFFLFLLPVLLQKAWILVKF